MQISISTVLHVVFQIQQASFPELLDKMLIEANATKSDLYEFLFQREYTIEKTSMYRYFNSNSNVTRFPDDRFVALFTEYIGLDEKEQAALIYVWELKRRDHYRRFA